jgi:hypothetical protein
VRDDHDDGRPDDAGATRRRPPAGLPAGVRPPPDDAAGAGPRDPDPEPMTYPGIRYALERIEALRRPPAGGDPDRGDRG